MSACSLAKVELCFRTKDDGLAIYGSLAHLRRLKIEPMTYKPKILLYCPIADQTALETFVEKCLHDDVAIIACIGPGSSEVDDLIDEIVVGDGSDDSRFVMTSWYENESKQEVLLFLDAWEGDIEEVRL